MPPREATKSKSMSCGRVSVQFFFPVYRESDTSELGLVLLQLSYDTNLHFLARGF